MLSVGYTLFLGGIVKRKTDNSQSESPSPPTRCTPPRTPARWCQSRTDPEKEDRAQHFRCALLPWTLGCRKRQKQQEPAQQGFARCLPCRPILGSPLQKSLKNHFIVCL